MSDIRVLHDIDQAFLNLVQGLFKQENHEGFHWFNEDENGDVDMSQIAVDDQGKYVINYDRPVGRFNNAEPDVQAGAVAILEDTGNGGIAKVLTDPDNCPNVKLRSEINWPTV